MSKINIREFARQLNLSVSTVSKALRDSHEISHETKQKVLALASQLNYTPNAYASSLRNKKSKTIAVVLPEVADSFFSLAINGIQSVAEEKGYHVLIYLSHEKFLNERNILEEFQSGRVDGVLISVSGETNTADHIKKLQSHNIPVIFFDRDFENVDASSVITNDQECGYEATNLLLKKGCKRPIFISISPTLSICKRRLDGFKDALKDAGIIVKETDILDCSGTDKANYEKIKTILQKKNGPDGIVASAERIATSVYVACHELKIKIPNDLRIVAFSTLEAASILDPPLTTITQPAFETGRTAARLLFLGMEKENLEGKNERIVVPSVLIERESTR